MIFQYMLKTSNKCHDRASIYNLHRGYRLYRPRVNYSIPASPVDRACTEILYEDCEENLIPFKKKISA